MSLSVDYIRGIWVSSNDENVLVEVKRSYAAFSPNVDQERVTEISSRAFSTEKSPSGDALSTTSNGMVRALETSISYCVRNSKHINCILSTIKFHPFLQCLKINLYKDYDAYVVFFTELQMLTQAEIFIGTFSSYVTRLNVLMREARGLSRTSSMSVDGPRVVAHAPSSSHSVARNVIGMGPVGVLSGKNVRVKIHLIQEGSLDALMFQQI